MPTASPAPGEAAPFLRLLAETPDVLTVVDAAGRILWDSPAVGEVLGYRPGELVGRNAFELVHPDDAPAALDLLLHTVASCGTSAGLVFRFRHRDGGWRVLESTGRATAEPGGPTVVVVSSREATPRALEVRARGERLERDFRAAQMEMVERLALAAECRDDDTGEHIRRVGDLAAALALAAGVPATDAELLRQAARLHDIGKIGVRDAVLRKRGPLTDAEWEEMRSHTTLGARLLSGGRSAVVRSAEQVALHHHERWDGAGYPLGLREARIPLPARIVALADYWDALTHDRCYRPAVPREVVLCQIREARGRHFDPALVDAFLGLDLVGAD
jgi:PAS domain S-box-containing protein